MLHLSGLSNDVIDISNVDGHEARQRERQGAGAAEVGGTRTYNYVHSLVTIEYLWLNIGGRAQC